MNKKNKIITPILIEVEDIKYKLMYISFSDDGSIYVLFPRKKGYKIDKDLNIHKNLIGEVEISLVKLDEEYNSPYISFHPRNKSLHINCFGQVCYKTDTEVINISEDKSTLVFPMCQIVFPIFDYLDKYESKKYISPLAIKSKSIIPSVGLSLEIWVHPVETFFSLKDLPHHKIRQEHMKIAGATTFSNENLKTYTCTLVICEITKKIKDNKIPGIIISIPNGKQQYAFELLPAD